MNKTAVIFPGIGYRCDKPLLYYASKLAANHGYDIIRITYPEFPINLKEASDEQLAEFLEMGIERTVEILKDTRLSDPAVCKTGDILFISKSIGTAVATAYAARHLNLASCSNTNSTNSSTSDTASRNAGNPIRHILFTPLELTFKYAAPSCGIAFNGTRDNWADWNKVANLCKQADIPLMTFKDANHSLETGHPLTDIKNLHEAMEVVENYI